MNPLKRLRERLDLSGSSPLTLTVGGELPKLIQALEKQARAGSAPLTDQDLLKRSVGKFWQERKIQSFRDAQLVAYGLTVRVDASKPCILEDQDCFQAVLNPKNGLGQWVGHPRRFRRCYRGLMSSYFSYNWRNASKPDVGQKNWQKLRKYLWKHNEQIVDGTVNLDWVDVAREHRDVFSDNPCSAYADAALDGDTEQIDIVTRELGIGQDSWFQWELIMAQVRHAIGLGDGAFKALIPNLLALIAGNELVREQAMIQILDRYAGSAEPGLHQELRDRAVAWWGNPWLPSDEVRWGGVKKGTRDLVAEWLRRDFIEAFFSKLARDGVGDKRRADFWLRYVKSMTDVHFGLGTHALFSRDRDFVVLREKMKGLSVRLQDPSATNNAFIMRIGPLVAVEFGGQSNALYGYDARRDLPFNTAMPFRVPVGAPNSLKHPPPVRVLWMRHQDGINGYRRWEEMFEAELKAQFGIVPDDQTQPARRRRPQAAPRAREDVATRAPRQPPPYSEEAFRKFIDEHGLRTRDSRAKGGNLHVYASSEDPQVELTLRTWGFDYQVAFQKWWKK